MRILVLGATGMLGNVIYRLLSESTNWNIFGTIRYEDARKILPTNEKSCLISGVDVLDQNCLLKLFEQSQPDVVINCISIAKPLLKINSPLDLIPIYTLLPHRLAQLCRSANARLIHISTDGVFSGSKGQYSEDDIPDPLDLYGIAKLLGEVRGPQMVTLRTSIIGPELKGGDGLLSWLLSQEKECYGFSRVIFSGMPTIVLAQVIRDYVIPNLQLSGVYNLSADPISKFELLELICKVYKKQITIIPVHQPVSDRSLNSSRFHAETDYKSPDWPELIRVMHDYKLNL